MAPVWPTCCHHPAASPVTLGFPLTNSTGRAPCAASACISASTLARYCAFVADQGVGRPDPNSSLRPIHGVAQALEATAFAKSASAAAGIDAGSAGLVGFPTLFGRWRTKYSVAAPGVREFLLIPAPLLRTTTPRP